MLAREDRICKVIKANKNKHLMSIESFFIPDEIFLLFLKMLTEKAIHCAAHHIFLLKK